MTENLLEQKDDQVQADPNKNYLTELVGEGKKFKSPEELARGKYESDTYIKLMEKRMDNLREDYLKLREDYTARASLEELVDKIDKRQLSSSEPPPAPEVPQPTIDPKQIESLVSNKVQEIETSKRQQDNFNTVRAKLQERFGSNYANVLKEQTESLGLTDNFVNDLARNHPTVFFKTFGLDAAPVRENFQSPPRTQQRSDSFAPSVQKRDWLFYEALRVNKPKEYLDPKTQIQMQKDVIELGEDQFYGT